MIKNISAGRNAQDVEGRSECIKERNEYMKSGKYSTIDGGITCFGTLVVVGDNHMHAAKYLKDRLSKITDISFAINAEKKAEQKYDVQVWEDGTEFDFIKTLEVIGTL